MTVVDKTKEITVVLYEPKYKALWDNFVINARNAHFFFKRDYMEYHADRFNDHSLMVYEGENLIALFPANLKNDIVYSHQGLTFGGLIISDDVKTLRMYNILKYLIDFLKSKSIKELVYKAMPHIYHRRPSEDDVWALNKLGAELLKRDITSIIRLEDVIKFTKGRRGCIKKAKQEGLVVRESNDLKTFFSMMESLLEEKYDAVPVHNVAEMQLLQGRFPENIKLFAAYKDELMLAGVLVYETDLVAKTQYISSTEAGRQLGAVDLIIDYLISDCYKTKLFFDFGTSTDNSALGFNEMLIAQKESFGARSVVVDVYRLRIHE